MSDSGKAKVSISAKAAALVRPEAPREEKLGAARGEAPLPPCDLVTVLLLLSRDQDAEIRNNAVKSLHDLSQDVLDVVFDTQDVHPLLLDALARVHVARPLVGEKISRHPKTARKTLLFLAENGVSTAGDILQRTGEKPDELSTGQETAAVGSPSDNCPETDEKDEEFKSKFQLAQELAVQEKIKFALTGDKEWRCILIKDNNKMVCESVMKNPRITEQEVLAIARSTVRSDEILRSICINKDWTKNCQIRKALIENHKTPLHHALRFLSSLGEKDLAFLAKNKNISSVIATQARRMLLQKNMGK